ncbi:hypothetical protein [Neotabrizicola sp. VNH66]|uniref:hypothetical protein n=1 Tax=Neotabrizicola sp. VNH66 TaxID=3400918 RepID=UPI003C03EFCE
MTNKLRHPMATLVERGLLPPDRAGRIESVLKILTASGPEVWSVTKVKRNPGAFMSVVIGTCPQVMSDSKRKDAEQIVALSADDLLSLVDAATKAAGPGFATGKEIYARLARSGAPLDVTSRGLAPRHQPRLSMKDALSAMPASGHTDAQG